MPDSLLTILKLVFLALLWLFFLRVLRAVWAEINGAAPVSTMVAAPAAAVPAPAPSRRRSSSTPPKTVRVIAPASAKGASFDVGDEATLGRGEKCTIRLGDKTVSTLHARLYRREGRLWVEDLGSTNGTFLNAKKVVSPVALQRGDRVTVGETVLEVAG